MRILLVIIYLILYNNLYGEEVNMITDSFLLDENIKVDVVIEVTESTIKLEMKIKNESDINIMLYKDYINRNRHFYFSNENEVRGKIIRRMSIEYDWRITTRAIDIIEREEEITYRSRLDYKREDFALGENDAFIIYDDERFIVFSSPASIKLVLKYEVSSGQMNNMCQIYNDAIPVPAFSRSYTIKEF